MQVRPCVLFENSANAHSQQAVWIESVRVVFFVVKSTRITSYTCSKTTREYEYRTPTTLEHRYNGKVLFLVQALRSQVACLVLNVQVLQMIFVRFVTARVSPALLACNYCVDTHFITSVCRNTLKMVTLITESRSSTLDVRFARNQFNTGPLRSRLRNGHFWKQM